MKTTIEVSDALFRQARQLARERGTTLRAVFESALRRELSAGSASPKKPFRLRDASFTGEGVREGIDLSDWSRVRRMIYEGRGG
jgi:hypothetical protein